MRILIVTQYFWPENFRINDLALGLKERGHEVMVFTGKPNYPNGKFYKGYSFFNKRKEDWNGIKIIRSQLIPRGKGGGARLFINYISFAFLGSLRALFLNIKADIIYVYEPSPITVGFPAIVLKWKTKGQLFFWVQDLWPQALEASGNISNKRIIKYANIVTKWIYRYCDKILMQSKAFTDYLLLQNVESNKMIYFPNSAEVFYKPIPKSVQYQKYFQSKYNLVFAGNIGESQAFDTLLKAATLVKIKNPAICWTIIGEGRMKEYVIKKIIEYNIAENFKLIGSFPPGEMPAFFAYADAMIVSLKKDFIFSLTIPSKLQSYMACGKPIIGSLDGEGARIIEQSQCGLVAPGEDEISLSEQVIRFFNLPQQEREDMAQNSLDYYNIEFNRDTLIDNLISLTHA